jgi:hypothetical protein
MEVEIELHRVDNWEALYINGECHDQSHSGLLEDWLFYCLKTPVTIKSVKRVYHEEDVTADQVMNCGWFPENLADLLQE